MFLRLILWYNVIVGIGVQKGIKGDNMSFSGVFYVFIKNRSKSFSKLSKRKN